MSAYSLPDLAVEQVKGIGETLFEGYFRNPAITAFHDVQEGIVADKQLLIFKRHTGLTGYKRTGCSTTADANFAIDEVNKTWTPKYISDRFAECYDDFLAKFFAYGLKAGIQKKDLTGTELAAFIEEQLKDELYDVFMRIAWFGDTAIDTLANGAVNNLVTAQLKYFNPINGFWKQIVDIVTADSARKSTSTITTRNAGNSYANQKFTTTDTTNQVATNTLDALYYDADERLSGMDPSQLVYICTKTVFDQYTKERKAFGSIAESYTRTEDGIRQVTCNGIDVVSFNFLDRIINNYLNNGTVKLLPHRAILTTKTNLVLGVESIGNLGQIEAWHSKDLEKYFATYGANIDAKVALNNMIQVAY